MEQNPLSDGNNGLLMVRRTVGRSIERPLLFAYSSFKRTKECKKIINQLLE